MAKRFKLRGPLYGSGNGSVEQLSTKPSGSFGPPPPVLHPLEEADRKLNFRYLPVGKGNLIFQRVSPTAQQQNEERLRFLREQTRRGRISSVLSGPVTSAGGGFQLGKKSLLGA